MERELGDVIGVSIGTALALEALVNSERPIASNFLFMNVRTLYRNYSGSFKDPHSVPPVTYAKGFIDEVTLIQTIISETIVGVIQPVLYSMSGLSLKKIMPHAKFRTHTTNKQKLNDKLETYVFKRLPSDLVAVINKWDTELQGDNSLALIITHFPLDLLSSNKFRRLGLLESHTGVIKPKPQWITKLSKRDIYQDLPFNILTIQLIGDNNNQFKAMGSKVIKSVLELSITAKWTTATTIAKIKFDLRKLRDPLLAKVLLDMVSTKLM